MSTDTSLITFKAISNFANELGEVFSDKHRPLKLYVHLINKTTLVDDEPIQKHINAFKSFCITNRDSIYTKSKKLTKDKIFYSKRVFINMKDIFELSDAETTSTIWKHLLTISAIVDPAGKARDILKEESKNGSGDEINFLTNIISKVESNIKPDSSPVEAITSIMQSGIFNDLISGMGTGLQDGSLDLSKLMGTVQKMVTKISADAGDPDGGEKAMNMISTMMSGMNQDSANGTGQPDIMSMLGPLMSTMMTQQGGNGNTIPSVSNILGSIKSELKNDEETPK
jgi:hypothetical protein